MSELPKDMSLPEKSAMTDNDKVITTAIGTLIRYIIVPLLLFYGSHSLDQLANETKELRRDLVATSNKLDTYKVASDAYKEIVSKQLEFLDYRISQLERNHNGDTGQFYTEFLGKHGARPTTNVSAMGESADIK